MVDFAPGVGRNTHVSPADTNQHFAQPEMRHVAGLMLQCIGRKLPPASGPKFMQIDPITNVAKDARILVVDDRQENITTLGQILGRAGYAICISLTDPREALAKFADIQPDLLLLDWHMEPVSGLEFIETLKNRVLPEEMPPILVLTADDNPLTRREALAVGATDFLSKPLDASEVLLRIRNLLQMRMLHRRVQESRNTLENEVRERTIELEETLTELREVQQQVIQQERLRALGVMAAGVAHDFNNALMIIRGYSEMFTSEPNRRRSAEEVDKAFQIIASAASTAADTVNRLREFYRPYRKGEDDRRPTDLNALVREATQLTQPKWETQQQARGLSIEVHTELRPTPRVSAAPSEIREVIMNLIFNAVDAMPQGGQIKVSTGVDENYAYFTVEDNGTGMTEETRRHCLEPFYSTKGDRGTGLGLAIVYGIVRRHAGLIRINTELNSGTQVTVLLPVATVGEENHPDIAPAMPAHSLNVLVVDDQPEIRHVLTSYLEHDAHKVITAENGCDALEKFRNGKFDLVITDRAMPKMNGDQLASAIKEIAPTEPVILLTAFADNARQPRDIDLLLSKPASLQMLRRAIAKVTAQPN
jgi:signal transduction histidine kinase